MAQEIYIGKTPKISKQIFKICKVIKGIIHFDIPILYTTAKKDVYVNEAKIIYDIKNFTNKGHFSLLVSLK